MSLPGADISSLPGDPGEWREHAGDIAWGAVLLTELAPGGAPAVNPVCGADWAALGDLGKGRIAYLRARPSTSAIESAAFFAKVAEMVGLEPQDGICVALEDADGRNPALVSSWAKVTLRALEAARGRKPLVRVSAGFAARGNCSGLGSWPLWLTGSPYGPRPWTEVAIREIAPPEGIASYADMRPALTPAIR